MLNRRTFLGAAGAAVLARPAIAQGTAARTLRFVPETSLSILDPVVTTAAVSTTHGYCVFDTLYGVDDKLQPQPQMAAGSQILDDGKVHEIKLRDGLKFHDGERVLARDCVASLKRWAVRDSFGQALAAAVDEWSAPDDKTIRVRLKRPFPHFYRAIGKPHSSAAFIMPERIAQTDPMTQVKEMVGSGPFRFLADEFITGNRMVYAKFDGYMPRDEPANWSAGGKRVHFDRLEWHVIPDGSTAVSALQNGEVDWLERPIADLAPALKAAKDVTMRAIDPFGLILGLRFNHLTPPFNNAALRRAVMMAVAQNDYLSTVTAGDTSSYRMCRAMFPCGLPGVKELGTDIMKQPPDLAAAKAAVQASGYKGEKVVVLNPSDHPINGPASQITANTLRQIGLNVVFQSMDWGTVTQRRVSKEPTDRGGWSIFHTNWPGSSVTNPAENLYIRGPGETGWFGWHDNPEIEKLTGDWLSSSDPAQAQAAIDGIQVSAFKSVPVVPLGQIIPKAAYASNLRDILDGSAPFFWNVKRA